MDLCAHTGGWTVAGILEHISIVEEMALNMIQHAIQQTPDPSITSVIAGQDELLVHRASSRKRQVSAPPEMHPEGGQSLESLTDRLTAAREHTREFASTTQADLRKHFAKHPFIGPIDCHQWLLLIGAHGERHRAQIEEILSEVMQAKA
jgi:uncharacterized damage-inducible protein DinB